MALESSPWQDLRDGKQPRVPDPSSTTMSVGFCASSPGVLAPKAPKAAHHDQVIGVHAP